MRLQCNKNALSATVNANEQSDEYDGAAAFAAPPNGILSHLSSDGDGLG
jgi:hypothetical protein